MPVPQAPLGRLPLAADEAHGPALAVLFSTAFTVHVLDLSVESDGYGDDYEDGVFDPAQHVFLCGSEANLSEADGALTLDRTGGACGFQNGVQVGRAAAFPGPQTFETTVRFAEPELCATYGITLGSSSVNFGVDVVTFSVVRSEENPDVVILSGVSEPMTPGPSLPTFARSEVALASIEENALLQLRLALEPGVGEVTPALSFRFCPALGCPGEGTLPFTPLVGTVSCLLALLPAQDDVCGVAANEFCPAIDGGAVDSPEAISSTVFAVPEPGGLAAAAAATPALAVLAGRRRARRAHRG